MGVVALHCKRVGGRGWVVHLAWVLQANRHTHCPMMRLVDWSPPAFTPCVSTHTPHTHMHQRGREWSVY